MHVCKWYLSAGTLQHLYTEIQESKFKEQAEKMIELLQDIKKKDSA